MIDLEQARARMVAEQLRSRGINDPAVLEAMRMVERHRFIKPELVEHAYDDGPLPIGEDQTISQPYIVAEMTQIAELKGHEKVLEIGTGCGYQTAILARLAREVYSIECIAELQRSAISTLRALGFTNCFFKVGDGSLGWAEAAPFDVILVTAAMPGIPRPLLEQLAPKGRLIAPIGEDDLQTLVRIARESGRWQERYFGECRFVKMVGKFGF
ncbi:MAG TPA: protein-L-isoaspartate(D-aspartate) O-methyltransferase [Candidatus Binataceae bacterium]|nr:protein-L-isoaspartate(D-aspartate) O-methyltransferase [Candidatus Binataceae bacterium]